MIFTASYKTCKWVKADFYGVILMIYMLFSRFFVIVVFVVVVVVIYAFYVSVEIFNFSSGGGVIADTMMGDMLGKGIRNGMKIVLVNKSWS